MDKARRLHVVSVHYDVAPQLEAALAVASVLMFLGTIVAVPIFLVRIPDDYFVRESQQRSLLRRFVVTLVGLTLVLVGVVMLVLPGQGILTILVGLAILELPFRDRVVGRFLRNPRVRTAIDELRRKAGKGSLRVPVEATPGIAHHD